MKIYTKSGDKGETSLLGGTRVLKCNERIEAYGTVDELNSFLGLVCAWEKDENRIRFIQNIQSRLFTIGSSLAAETDKAKDFKPDIVEADILHLEQAIDEMNASLPQMTNFILPGGNQLIAATHVARTVCRRAERLIIKLADMEEIEELIIKYLNRLSDYLFVLARKQGNEWAIEEIPWRPRG